MKEQMSVTELIQTVSQSMKGDGIKQDYITQLSYTWKALEQYLIAHDLVFSKENAFTFLKDKYDIHADQNFAKLRPIDKRRKRAVCALLHCADGKSVYREKTYWPCSFHDAYVLPFYEFLNERKSQDLALSTINRDIYTLNHFSKYLQESRISKISDISPAIVQGFMKWLAEQKNLPTLKSASASMRVLLRYLYQNGYIPEDYSPVVLSVRCRKVVPSVYQTDEIEKILVSFNQSSAVGIRNYAMVLMAARLGIRASDICACKQPLSADSRAAFPGQSGPY